MADRGLGIHDFADAGEEPRIEGGGPLNLVIGQPVAHGLGDDAQTVRGLFAQRLEDRAAVGRAGDGDFVKAGQAGFKARQCFLHRLVDGAADGHHFAHGFHRGGQFGLGAGELFKRKARDLGDDIVDGRLERGGGDFGDVIVQLVQRVADRQFGRDLGDGKARGLGGQRRRARDAGVHLDHDHAAIGGIHRPLHVGAAGFHADFAQYGDRGRAHDLVFFVGQRQRGGYGDRIAGMDAHRVDVFNGADDDGVIGGVAHHLHLIFFPAEQGFIDEDLRHGGGFKPAPADGFIVVAVIGDAAAGAAKGESGADDRGQADIFDGFKRGGYACLDVIFARGQFRGGDDGGLGVFKADPVHRFAEQFTIFCHFNGRALGADQFNIVLFQHAHVG